MRDLELAIAVSARTWPDRLRHFLADHGGARVRVSAMGPEDLLAEAFDVLLIDDICSFLTPRLVDLVSEDGRRVVGVYDPSEFADGKERLLECGVADVVEAAAAPEEFLSISKGVASDQRIAEKVEERVDEPVEHGDEAPSATPAIIAVGGPSGGVGATEVGVHLAAQLARRGPTVLVDCDENAPSVAQRLGLPLHPNIRTAVDVLEHRTGSLDRVLHQVDGRGFVALPGLANVADWAEVRSRQVADVIRTLGLSRLHVVVNVGSRIEPSAFGEGLDRSAMSRTALGLADMVVAVGQASPVGVARLLEWTATAQPLNRERSMHIMLNRAPSDRFRRGELLQEVTRTYQPASFVFLPEDSRLSSAAWSGSVVDRGRFRKAIDRWAASFVPVVES